MAIVCNSSNLNNIDKGTPTNYSLIFPKIPTESSIGANNPFIMNIHTAMLPSVSLAMEELRWQGNKTRRGLIPMEFDPWLVSFTVDSRLANWKLLFDWMSYINNNNDKIADYHRRYSVDCSMVVTDNYKNSVLEVIFVSIWPSMLQEVSFSQREGDVQLESSVTFNYDYFYIRDTTTWPAEFSSSSRSSSSISESYSSSSSSSLSSSSSSSSSSLSSSSSSSSSSLSSSSESIYSSSSTSFTPVELLYHTSGAHISYSTNYPVLLKITPDMGIIQSGQPPENLSITRTSDSTEFIAEVVDWNTTNNTGIVWFAMPLTTGVNTNIKIAISSIDNSTNIGMKGTAIAQSVWSSATLGYGYSQVIHFNEPASASTFYDSTSNGINITNTLPASAWIEDTPIGHGWHFNGVNQLLDTGRRKTGFQQTEVYFKADTDPSIKTYQSGPVQGNYDRCHWHHESIPAFAQTYLKAGVTRSTSFSPTASAGIWYYYSQTNTSTNPQVLLNDIFYDDGTGSAGTFLGDVYNIGLAGIVGYTNYCWDGTISEYRAGTLLPGAERNRTHSYIFNDEMIVEGSYSSSSSSVSSSSSSVSSSSQSSSSSISSSSLSSSSQSSSSSSSSSLSSSSNSSSSSSSSLSSSSSSSSLSQVSSSSSSSSLSSSSSSSSSSLSSSQSSSSKSSTILDDNLLSYLRFENDFVDATGNYTITNNEVTFGAGKVVSAGYFDGANDYLDFNDGVLSNLSQFSLSYWVYFNDTSGDEDLFVLGDHATGEPFVMWRDEASPDSIAFFVTDNNDDYSGAMYSAFTPTNNTWYHIVFTYDGGNEARMYINGVEDGNSPFNMTGIDQVKNTIDNLVIGTNVAHDKDFNGRLDEIAIYGSILTSAAAVDLYNNGNGRDYWYVIGSSSSSSSTSSTP